MHRAELDLLSGDTAAAAARQEQIAATVGRVGSDDWSREGALRAAELRLWTGAPDRVLPGIRPVLAGLKSPGQAIFCGPLLTRDAGLRRPGRAGPRAPGRGGPRARRSRTARTSPTWAGRLPADPFAEHPFAATIPAEHASFEAERTRLAGSRRPRPPGTPRRKPGRGSAGPTAPDTPGGGARRRGWPPGRTRRGALRAAAALAAGHAPLQAEVRKLALRARIPLDPAAPPAGARRPGPGRELRAD